MPKMNGIEFLSKAKKIHPDTTQILLTGYADKENAIRAINELGIFKYIEKPWGNDEFTFENPSIFNKVLRVLITISSSSTITILPVINILTE